MQLVLLRHAKKEASGDSGLSLQGKVEAESLIGLVANGRVPPPTACYTSPKKRAYETLLPIAKHYRINIQTLLELDEKTDSETAEQFDSRVSGFLSSMTGFKKQGCLWVATHLDWIESTAGKIRLPKSYNFETALPLVFALRNHTWEPEAWK